MTSLVEKRRLKKLRRLAAARYGQISASEVEILRTSVAIEYVDITERPKPAQIRSEFLRWLMTDNDAAQHLDPLGLRVSNITTDSRLNISHCKVPFAVEFRYCMLAGGLALQWAEVPYLYLFHCRTDWHLWADGARVAGDFVLDSFATPETISIVGAHIAGNFDCSGAQLTAAKVALDLSGTEVGGDIFLNGCFSSAGTVQIVNASVHGDLICSGAHLTSKDEALILDAATVAGDVFLNEGFMSTGAITLLGAQVGGNLNCDGAVLNQKEEALSAVSARIQNVYLRTGFRTSGTINLRGAQIIGDLDLQGANELSTVLCDRMSVGRRIVLLDIVHPEKTSLQLYGASVAALHDDEASWPPRDFLALDGLIYQGLVTHKRGTADQVAENDFGDILPLKAESRIAWLRLQPESERLNAQPWMQLARYLESMGDTQGSKEVVYEFHRQRAQGSLSRPVTYVYDRVEESPLRVSWPILLLWATGSFIFWRAGRIQGMRSTELPKGPRKADEPCEAMSVPFHPVIYALENVLPVVRLGQDSAWTPDPSVSGDWLPEGSKAKELRRWAQQRGWAQWLIRLDYKRLAFVRWSLILVGWGLALILAAAIGEHFKH